MRVAAFQFDVRRGDVDANVAAVVAGLREASERGVELVVLPEMWPTSFVADGEDADWVRATDDAVERARELSKELDLVVCGSAFARGAGFADGERLRNQLHVFDAGEAVLRYDKVHLFSPAGEQLGFSAGSTPPSTVEVRGVKLSGVVCYDVRFAPVLRSALVDEAELLVVPAQWADTRAAHWRALLLGRAVEHQAFVIGTNRTGTDLVGRKRLELHFPGNSTIASPHGIALAEGDGPSGLVVADLDLDSLRTLRRRVPIRADEPRDLYRSW